MAKSQANLTVVDQKPKKPLDMGPDLYAADKAKIAATDWSRVHIIGDRRAPVELPDTRKRSWTK